VIRDHWSEIEPIIQDVGQTVQAAARVIADALKLVVDLLHGNWSAAWNDAKKLVGDVVTAIKAELNVLKDELKLALSLIPDLFTRVFGIVSYVRDKVDDIIGFFRSLPGRAIAAVAGIGNTLNSGLRNMRDFASGVVSDIVGFFTGLPSKAETAAKNLGLNFLKGLASGFDKLGSDLISLVVNPINAVLKISNDLRIPGFSIKLPTVDTHIPAVGKVGGESLGWSGFDFPDVGLLPVPKLALGGLVTSPTLALIGEAGPEAVVPLDKWAAGGVTISMAGANFYGDARPQRRAGMGARDRGRARAARPRDGAAGNMTAVTPPRPYHACGR
jgi:hypothetical protein